ncbi:MAG TPA: DNA translocase FtsK [Erysipelotrichaceae bacterium]|uniref:FtsK/SpoIIIE family DNA translocase n=1 Tax=Sharpea azabuensis TaxID=322505 RepID=UPI000E9106AB|nr:DNA translocase FtsK [Sharpea azabuensis]HAJ16100.1 DNA translocase FtsK [Erysipelotrichaceae bacterium]HAV18481.1 DNA translocase FtsK [Erysipelotrichaceae bacterium]
MAKKKKKKVVKKNEALTPLKIRILNLIVIFFIVITLGHLGFVGKGLFNGLSYLFGPIMTYIGLSLIGLGLINSFIKGEVVNPTSPEAVGTYMMYVAVLIFLCFSKEGQGVHLIGKYIAGKMSFKGGLLGIVLYGGLSELFDALGALIAAIIIFSIGFIMVGTKLYLRYKQYRDEHPLPERKEEPIEPKVINHQDDQVINKVYVKKKGPKFFDFLGDKEEELPLFPDEVFEDRKKEVPLEPEITSAFAFNDQTERLDIVDKKPQKTKQQEKKEPVVDVPMPSHATSLAHYQLPPVTLLNPIKRTKSSNEEMHNAKATAATLEELLKQFGVNAHVEELHIGPTVTKYELRLEIGTRVNKILSLQDDIQLALAAKEIRIEAPIPGKPYVGIEIPNKTPAMVPFNEVFQLSKKDPTYNNVLAVPLGKDIEGNIVTAELNKMPHLLIAGATGSGKSVCVNVIITSLLMKATPEQVRLILVDPKKVELSNYNGVPHLLAPVVTDAKKAAGVLQEVVKEMERRYEVFAENNQRNMTNYNEYAKKFNQTAKEEEQKEIMPYIVVILDEVADLMMVASKTVEDCIMRISQMARAAGIHMIVATQRPSTNIITGVIKANIPSRIAFAVSSSVDSRTILDSGGAEKLLGKGDMLFSPMNASSATRVQGAFVDDSEVARVVEYASSQMDATYEDKYVNAKEASNEKGSSSEDDDPYADFDDEYEECRDFVIQEQRASTSLLQRRFRIGYNKAARIMDQLEENGVIGPQIGSKPREVYIRSYSEEPLEE